MPEGAIKIAVTQRPKGAVHLCHGDIFLAFDKAIKQVKANYLLHTITGGTVKAQNVKFKLRVLYDINEKSLEVSEGIHVDKLGKLLVSETETIEMWGKDIHAGKVHPKFGTRWPARRGVLVSTGGSHPHLQGLHAM